MGDAFLLQFAVNQVKVLKKKMCSFVVCFSSMAEKRHEKGSWFISSFNKSESICAVSGSSGKDCSFKNVWMGDGKERRMQEPNLESL